MKADFRSRVGRFSSGPVGGRHHHPHSRASHLYSIRHLGQCHPLLLFVLPRAVAITRLARVFLAALFASLLCSATLCRRVLARSRGRGVICQIPRASPRVPRSSLVSRFVSLLVLLSASSICSHRLDLFY